MPKKSPAAKSVQLRLDPALLRRIDAKLAPIPKPVRPSRHAWIVQAILEKLERRPAGRRGGGDV